MDKVRCMLIDANWTPKLWSYLAHYALFATITTVILPSMTTRVQLEPSKFLNKLDERSAEGLLLGIDPSGPEKEDLL
jgi:hypothetical protein